MVQLGKRTAGMQSSLETQEEVSESVSEQVLLLPRAQPWSAC